MRDLHPARAPDGDRPRSGGSVNRCAPTRPHSRNGVDLSADVRLIQRSLHHQHPSQRRWRPSLAVRLMVLLCGAEAVLAQTPDRGLTNAVDVLSLSAEEAQTGIPVSVEGVVTAAQPDWQGKFFVQDDSAGIFVVSSSGEQPVPGDVVTVTGVSHPGGFAPIINQARWEKRGTAPLPPAKPVLIDQLMAGVEDSQRIEMTGIVRAAELAESAVVYEVASGGYRLRVYTPLTAAGDPELLIGARVRVRGTAATSFHAALRHLVAVTVYVPHLSDLIIEKSNPEDPFRQPVIPLDNVAKYRRDQAPGYRIHVRGTVVYQRPGVDLFLQDSTGALQVKTRQTDTVVPGDVVEVIGFPDFDQLLPVLQDAQFRRTDEPAAPPAARPATLAELQAGYHHADLITIQGKLLDRISHPAETTAPGALRAHVTLTLQSSNFLFTAEGPATESNAGLAALPLGSTLGLTGICMLRIRQGGTLESGDVGTMESLQLLLPSEDSVHLLRKPSWLTPGRLLLGLALWSVVLLLAISWIVTISRKNVSLRTLVQEKVKAQHELQKAH